MTELTDVAIKVLESMMTGISSDSSSPKTQNPSPAPQILQDMTAASGGQTKQPDLLGSILGTVVPMLFECL